MFESILKKSTQSFIGIVIVLVLIISLTIAYFFPEEELSKIGVGIGKTQIGIASFLALILWFSIPASIVAASVQMSMA
jgi:hypothetical protein